MKRVISTVCCLFMAVLLSCWAPSQAQRQQTQPPTGYGLPAAQLSGRDCLPGQLPVVNGLHLDSEGQTRQPGTASQPYDPGEESLHGALVRWNQRCFPLKIWISDGRHLPDVPWDVIKDDRVPRVLAMLQKDPRSFEQLPQVEGWTDEMAQATADGFERWRDMDRLGVVKYGFVDYPEQADILVFYTNRFIGAEGPGGTSVRGQTYGMDFTPQQVAEKLRLGQRTVPVVIELKINPQFKRHNGQSQDSAPEVSETELERLRGDAAHEFGHALGIKKHSPYYDDLMYVNRMVPAPSAADKATLQWLYSRMPTYWHYSSTVSK